MMKKLILIFAVQLCSVLGGDSLDTWHARTSPTNSRLNAVIFAADRFVAVGDKTGFIISSSDGTVWEAQAPTGDKNLYGLAWGNETFVAIGAGGRALTSPNGADWFTESTGTTANFNRVRFVNGRFVAMGDGGNIYSSTHGSSWTPHLTPSSNYWADITYFDGKYIAVGYNSKNGEARYGVSTDLNSWEIGYTGYTRYLNTLTPVNGELISVGYAGGAQRTSNGIDWKESEKASTRWLFGATLAANDLVAVGESGAIASWNAAEGWLKRTSGTTRTLKDVAFGLDTFVAVGENGVILQSDPSPAESAAGCFLSQIARTAQEVIFQLHGEQGKTYQIEASSDLKSWASVSTVSCEQSPVLCTIPGETAGQRYYRALEL